MTEARMLELVAQMKGNAALACADLCEMVLWNHPDGYANCPKRMKVRGNRAFLISILKDVYESFEDCDFRPLIIRLAREKTFRNFA